MGQSHWQVLLRQVSTRVVWIQAQHQARRRRAELIRDSSLNRRPTYCTMYLAGRVSVLSPEATTVLQQLIRRPPKSIPFPARPYQPRPSAFLEAPREAVLNLTN